MKKNKISMVITIFIILLLLKIILTYIGFKYINEGYTNKYLYPLQDLQKICQEKGLEPSYMPRVCYKSDGTYDPFSNCECIGKDGMCETCYKPLKRYELNGGVIYDSFS